MYVDAAVLHKMDSYVCERKKVRMVTAVRMRVWYRGILTCDGYVHDTAVVTGHCEVFTAFTNHIRPEGNLYAHTYVRMYVHTCTVC